MMCAHCTLQEYQIEQSADCAPFTPTSVISSTLIKNISLNSSLRSLFFFLGDVFWPLSVAPFHFIHDVRKQCTEICGRAPRVFSCCIITFSMYENVLNVYVTFRCNTIYCIVLTPYTVQRTIPLLNAFGNSNLWKKIKCPAYCFLSFFRSVWSDL